MNQPPEIIAALIQFETAKLNANVAAMQADNAARLSADLSPAYSDHDFCSTCEDHEKTVTALLAQLESPSPNPDTVTISCEDAHELTRNDEFDATRMIASKKRVRAELERVAKVKL